MITFPIWTINRNDTVNPYLSQHLIIACHRLKRDFISQLLLVIALQFIAHCCLVHLTANDRLNIKRKISVGLR